VKAVHRKGMPKHFFPETREELLELEAMAIEAGRVRSVKVRCPLCGDNYFAGHGHLDSAACLVTVNLRRELEAGFVTVNRNRTQLLDDAGVDHHLGPGATEPPTREEMEAGEFKVTDLYKGVVARDRMFAPVWADRVLDATRRKRSKLDPSPTLTHERRVHALRAVGELPRLQEVVNGLDDRWERDVFRCWLLPIVASAGDTWGDVKTCLEIEHDELLAAWTKRHLELRAQRGVPS
jgi:hypothetical protein